MENEIYIKKELKRLEKLRKLVITEIDNTKADDDSLDMTIIDLEEWLQEIEQEIAAFSR